MKTMKLHKSLSRLLTLFLLLVSTSILAGETKWEVATLFFGQNEDAEFQKSVEENLAELSKIAPSATLSVSTYRESPSTINQRSKLLSFLKKSFKDPASKKMLVFYGHGEGPLGMRDLRIQEMKKLLNQTKIKFEIIWFDSCFLANLEFLFELRHASNYFIASQEAEFSSGLPFESLSELTNIANPDEAAIFLGKRFIESYSYLKNGQQRDSVSTSSATISVIDTKHLESFAYDLKKISTIIKSLPEKEALKLQTKLAKKYSMDKAELVDLGRMLIELRVLTKDPIIDSEITKLIRALNITSVKKLKTNPHIRITPPTPDAIMVFGFNYWSNGHKEEFQTNSLFDDILSAKTFIDGPNQKQWPIKQFKYSSLYISPFAPGINSFDYYFLDAKGSTLLSEALSFTRTHDLVEMLPTNDQNSSFLIYSAYTQRLGVDAERYTGLNITLFNTVPSIDYFELEFNQFAQWLQL